MDRLDSLRAFLRLSRTARKRPELLPQLVSRAQAMARRTEAGASTGKLPTVAWLAATCPSDLRCLAVSFRAFADGASSPRSEVKSCTNFCMDCKLSDWGEWSTCTRSADFEGLSEYVHCVVLCFSLRPSASDQELRRRLTIKDPK